jgi:ATP-dependent Lon protease
LLNKAQERAGAMGIHFDWKFAPNLHDRSIIVDHHRWKILLGRGLDIYAPWDGDMFNPLFRYPEMRPCKSFTVTYIDTF